MDKMPVLYRERLATFLGRNVLNLDLFLPQVYPHSGAGVEVGGTLPLIL